MRVNLCMCITPGVGDESMTLVAWLVWWDMVVPWMGRLILAPETCCVLLRLHFSCCPSLNVCYAEVC